MHTFPSHKPVVMVFSGHDPSGGAGLVADIETLSHLGVHPVSVITALTVQDTHTVSHLFPVEADKILQQARAVLEDLPVSGFKVGLIGSVHAASALAAVFSAYPDLPVVLDPVLASGGGKNFADEALIEALRSALLPHTTVLTPNSVEARRLVPSAKTLPECAAALQALGCPSVLITGGHEPDTEVINTLYTAGAPVQHWAWPRWPHTYHGSGCTLASAIAAGLAHRNRQSLEDLSEILFQAQAYTWQALKAGAPYNATGQWLPDRHFPAH